MTEQTPIITKLEVQKKDKDRLSVFINGTFAFGVHVDVLVAYGLKKGMELPDSLQSEILDAETIKKAYIKAVHLISYKPRTCSEMKKKLMEKEFDEHVAEAAVQRLLEHGYLDDRRFAENYVESRMRKYGRKRLFMELVRKGLDKGLIEQVLAELLEAEAQEDQAMELARKKLAQCQGLDPQKQAARIQGMLLRKGYDYGVVNRVIRELDVFGSWNR